MLKTSLLFKKLTNITGKYPKNSRDYCTPDPLVINHYLKSARIRGYSGPHFCAFRLNLQRYFVSLRIQSKCEKIRTRITPNMDTFYAVYA